MPKPKFQEMKLYQGKSTKVVMSTRLTLPVIYYCIRSYKECVNKVDINQRIW